ncbi:MAG TPA: hypothetical protein VND19_16840 [Acetobacteraceae bacterium]|nr:hypothetical protein [Acetobacteraceae bacterium]
MTALSVTAEAGQDIIRRLSTGEYRIRGIEVTDRATGEIRPPDNASRILKEAAETIEDMRTKLHAALTDPEFVLRHTNPELADTTKLVTAGKKLLDNLCWMGGRAVMIDAGLMSDDPSAAEFETVLGVDVLVFETIGQSAHG